MFRILSTKQYGLAADGRNHKLLVALIARLTPPNNEPDRTSRTIPAASFMNCCCSKISICCTCRIWYTDFRIYDLGGGYDLMYMRTYIWYDLRYMWFAYINASWGFNEYSTDRNWEINGDKLSGPKIRAVASEIRLKEIEKSMVVGNQDLKLELLKVNFGWKKLRNQWW